MLAMHVDEKELLPRIHGEPSPNQKEKFKQTDKWAKGINRLFKEDKMRIVKKHLKRYSNLIVIRKV